MSKRTIKISIDNSTRKKVYVKAFITSAICTIVFFGVGVFAMFMASIKPGTHYSDDEKNVLLRKGYLLGWGAGTGLTVIVLGIIWIVANMFTFGVNLTLIVLGAAITLAMIVLFVIFSTKVKEK